MSFPFEVKVVLSGEPRLFGWLALLISLKRHTLTEFLRQDTELEEALLLNGLAATEHNLTGIEREGECKGSEPLEQEFSRGLGGKNIGDKWSMFFGDPKGECRGDSRFGITFGSLKNSFDSTFSPKI